MTKQQDTKETAGSEQGEKGAGEWEKHGTEEAVERQSILE